MPPIMIPAEHTPSLVEARSLARIVTPIPALNRTTPQILEQFMALLSNPDVQSFLFSPDQLHIQHLTSPAFLQTCITGSLRYLRVEPSTHKPVGSLSDFTHGKYVFSPLFTVSGCTLGFGMNEFNHLRGDEWGGDVMMYMRTGFRFVRNDAQMELLIMHDIADMNAVCMEYSRTITPTTQYRASICFHRDKLFEAQQLGLSVHNLIASIDQICAMYEYRDCPNCSLDRHACRCALSSLTIRKPRHPLDHDAFAANMASRLGSWTGTMSISSYEYGRFQHKSLVGSRTIYTGGVDLQLLLSMRSWALAELNGKESPLQTILGKAEDENGKAIVETVAGDELQLVSTSFTQSVPPAQPVQPVQYDVDPSLFLDEDETDPDFSPLNEFPALSEICEDPFLNSSICATSEEISSEVVESAARRARVHTLEPLIDLSVQTGDSAKEESSKVSSNDPVRELKAELRKQRNRMSAKRSNLKKKMQNEKLKSDLKQTKDKATFLRGKETSLRNENLLLRRLLAETVGQS